MISETDQLVEAYLDNELQDADCAALCSWLQHDRANVDHFIRACFLHWQLFAIGQRNALQHGVSDAPRRAGLAKLSGNLSVSSTEVTGISARIRERLGRHAILAIAATLLVACSLGGWTLVRMRQPDAVAQLTQTTVDVAWADGSMKPQSGVFLHRGQLVDLRRGRVLATLSSGVQVVVQSPATFRIESGDKLFLQFGRITVIVPRQASGFVLESPIARFVDLGTEYTVDMQSPASCELHVFSGLVEMQPSNSQRTDQLRVPGGRAIEYDSASGNVVTLPYEPGERMSF